MNVLDEVWFAEAMSGDEQALGVDNGPEQPLYEAFFTSLTRCELAALAPKMAKMLLDVDEMLSIPNYDTEFKRLTDLCDEIRKIVGE